MRTINPTDAVTLKRPAGMQDPLVLRVPHGAAVQPTLVWDPTYNHGLPAPRPELLSPTAAVRRHEESSRARGRRAGWPAAQWRRRLTACGPNRQVVAWAGTNHLLVNGYVAWVAGELIALAQEPVWDRPYAAAVWWSDRCFSVERIAFVRQQGRSQVFRWSADETLENITDRAELLISGQPLVRQHKAQWLLSTAPAQSVTRSSTGPADSTDPLLLHLSLVRYPCTVLLRWANGDWGLARFGSATLPEAQAVLIGKLQVQAALLLGSGKTAAFWVRSQRYGDARPSATTPPRLLLAATALSNEPLQENLPLRGPGQPVLLQPSSPTCPASSPQGPPSTEAA